MNILKGVRWRLLIYIGIFVFIGMVIGSILTFYVLNNRLISEIGHEINFRYKWLNYLMKL